MERTGPGIEGHISNVKGVNKARKGKYENAEAERKVRGSIIKRPGLREGEEDYWVESRALCMACHQ
jgi:hypothetical protein